MPTMVSHGKHVQILDREGHGEGGDTRGLHYGLQEGVQLQRAGQGELTKRGGGGIVW